MAIADIIRNGRRFFRRWRSDDLRPHEANAIIRVGSAGWNVGRKKYCDIYFWLVVNRIFNGMRNVNFRGCEEASDEALKPLCRFLEDNDTALLWQWWSKGYIVVDITKGVDKVNMVSGQITTDGDGRVVQPNGKTWVVVYSDEYLTQRLTAFRIIRNELDEIDDLRSADNYLTCSLGALGIISGKEMPMAAKDKEDFLKELKCKVGATPDKYQFIIATGALSYTPIQVPIEALKLEEKETRSLKLICDYFGVPFDLVSFSGASTYSNMAEAVRLFYSNCISTLAEVLLQVGRHAIRRDVKLFVTADALTFDIDNVAVAAEDKLRRVEIIDKTAEAIGKVEAVGIDAEKLKRELEVNL